MFTEVQRNRLVGGIVAFLAIVSIYFVVKLINEIRAGEYIGTKDTPSTITVAGDGEVSAVPDIATISFTARADGTTTKVAQEKESEMINKAIDYLKNEKKIDEKDIKTSTYYTQPKYEYAPCTKTYCPANRTKISGYEASQTVDVKVRDIDMVGDILTGLGAAGITEINGPNFAIDDEDAVKEEARGIAIQEARDKAEKLARDLGVHIVRVTSFQESTGGYPMYYAKDALQSTAGSEVAPAPSIPAGENKVTVNVTITYEIR